MLERRIYFQVADLLNMDVDLIFYETTSVHFEVEDEDSEERTFRGRVQAPLRKRGHSKNRRTEAVRVAVHGPRRVSIP